MLGKWWMMTFLIALIVVGWLAFWLSKSFSRVEEIWQGQEHDLPVLAITTNPDNLWDEEIGIYVKGENENIYQTGDAWEREAVLNYYDKEGKLELSQNIGLRLHGWNMRSMPQKAFRLLAKDNEGENSMFEYPFFGEEGNSRYGSLVLRVSDSNLTMMRDQLASRLAKSVSDLEVQLGRPVVVYLNNEYWGLYLLQERYDDEYFKEKYRIRPGMLGMIEVPLRSGEDRGQAVAVDKGDMPEAKRYNLILSAVRACGGCEGYTSIQDRVDASNLLDYLLLELFFMNQDWPNNNIKAWRFKVEPMKGINLDELEVLDGRFRWLLFDLDVGFGSSTETKEKMRISAKTDSYNLLLDDAFLFRNLFFDQGFRRRYLHRVEELVEDGLSGEKAVKIIDELAEEIRPEMQKQIKRWGSESSESDYQVVGSIEEWERRVELLKEFVINRPGAFYNRTIEYLEKSEQWM